MNNLILTIIGFSIIFLFTSLGASFVFILKREISPKINSIILGFASGVMIASSIWSLILPSIELSHKFGNFAFLPTLLGIVLGGAMIITITKFVKKKIDIEDNQNEVRIDKSKLINLFIVITIHNIPEGLAVGLVYGISIIENLPLYSAFFLALGIGIQNIPEGSSVSLPLYTLIKSKNKAFAYGVLSGTVEPIFAVIGFYLSKYIINLQSFFLSFAAGAMLFVVIDDLIPEAKRLNESNLSSIGFVIGFSLMMALDVALS